MISARLSPPQRGGDSHLAPAGADGHSPPHGSHVSALYANYSGGSLATGWVPVDTSSGCPLLPRSMLPDLKYRGSPHALLKGVPLGRVTGWGGKCLSMVSGQHSPVHTLSAAGARHGEESAFTFLSPGARPSPSDQNGQRVSGGLLKQGGERSSALQ